jgi:ribosome-associated protein
LVKEDIYKLACEIAKVLDSKLAKDITILKISNVSSIADYFVICSADTTTQVKALSGEVRAKIEETFGITPRGSEEDIKNRWHLLDYGDAIVHIMHKEEREFYTIEKFWNHACTITQDEWEKDAEDV